MASTDPDLKVIRESFTEDEALWAPIREKRAHDIRTLGPESTWDDKDRRARKEAGRPCLSFDEKGQYVNQLVNDARETKRAIEVNPAGDESSEDQARFIGALVRQIEYRSNAQLAYTQMFEDTAQGGYGFLRVSARYIQDKVHTPSARSFDQELVIQAIPNPDLVTPGYFAQPDLSDCTRMWVHESYTVADFNRRWPKFHVESARSVEMSVGPSWMHADRVWVRELWELKTRPRTLVMLPAVVEGGEPVAIWADTIPEEQREILQHAVRERVVQEPYACQTITNGVDILEKKEDWPGRYLPIVGCVGKILWQEHEREILSLHRLSDDAQQFLNYNRTSAAEMIGMTPKVPWFRYKGSLDPVNAAALAASNQVPAGEIMVDPMPEGWNPAWGPASFPQRIAYEPAIQAFEMAAESARRSIQASMGLGFLPTDAQRLNQKSGVALKEIATSAAKGAYHFVDHYEHALMRVGKVVVDLIPHYYDTPRDVHVRGADDQTIQVRINDPAAPAPQDYGGKPISLQGAHEFDITIATGPSYAHERDKASEFADQLVAARPEVFQLIGGDIIRLKNLGPIGDKIADILDAMAPPAVQAMKRGNQPASPEVQQAMAQLQQAQQMIQQLQRVIETEQIKGQTQLQIRQLDGQIKLALAELQGQQKLAQLGAQASVDIDTREDEQAHEMALQGADAAAREASAEDAARQGRLSAMVSRRV